jgi:hypothetical protein
MGAVCSLAGAVGSERLEPLPEEEDEEGTVTVGGL